MITLSTLQIIDLFFRFAAVGALCALCVSAKQNSKPREYYALVSLALCISAYVVLTAPIENSHYGWLRRVLLLLTDLSIVALTFFAQTRLAPEREFKDYPKWAVYSTLGWTAFLVLYFLGSNGSRQIHDINHFVALLVFAYLIYRCIAGYQDDLSDKRRKFRLLIVIGCGLYMFGLTVLEQWFTEVRDSAYFSVANAALMLCAILAVIAKQSTQPHALLQKPLKTEQATKDPRIVALTTLMEGGFYATPDLSIGVLAQSLKIPEHQLRQLINQTLGFSNFSHFLNSYRIPAICEQLKDPTKQHIPILTLALEMGYGSIASFNRAFKQQMQITPTEFRAQI